MGRPKKEKTDDESGTPQEVKDILAELGERATYVTLWKVESGKEHWVDTFPPADWSLEKVRSYGAGAGEYRVRIAAKGQRGDNKSQWAKTRTFYVWGNAAGPQSGGGSSSLTEKLLLAIAPQLVGKLVDKPVTDPLLVELIRASGKGQGPDAVAVQQLVESARSSEFEKGRAFGRAEAVAETAGSGDADSPLTAAIKEVGPILADAMKRNRAMPTQHTRATARVVADAATPSTATAAPDWVRRVAPFTPHLLKWADGGKTPEVKAINILDDLSDDDRESLAVSCESETFVQDVFHWLPQLASSDARRQWFTQFLTQLQNMLAPVDDDTSTGDADDGATGETDQQRADAGPGPAGAAAAGGGSAGAADKTMERSARARPARGRGAAQSRR